MATDLNTLVNAYNKTPATTLLAATPAPVITNKFATTVDTDDPTQRFVSALAALIKNVAPVNVLDENHQPIVLLDAAGKPQFGPQIDPATGKPKLDANGKPTPDTTKPLYVQRFDKGQIQTAINAIDGVLAQQLDVILHNDRFRQLESAWRGLDELVSNTNLQDNISIEFIDVSKDELKEDFVNNSSDILGSSLFQKVYVDEYDQYGGRPYGTMLGLYTFNNTPETLFWLKNMGKVARYSHAPFISSVNHEFFVGHSGTIDDVQSLLRLSTHMSQPRFGRWQAFRDSDEAPYIGLTFPRYVQRQPWDPDLNPISAFTYKETTEGDNANYLWGNAAILFARNLVRSFSNYRWCQYIRGVRGGGLITGLPSDQYEKFGQTLLKPPVELVIPDYREYEFAEAGFMPLVYKKNSAEATFFSTQSVKKSTRFKDPRDSENSQLITNLSYTFSVTRMAHYIKCIQRDNIGSAADDVYIQSQIDKWIKGYVTTVVNPDDLTLRFFPFKAAKVTVTPRDGEIGWYDCDVEVLPHIQFEGLNVILKLETRLGKK